MSFFLLVLLVSMMNMYNGMTYCEEGRRDFVEEGGFTMGRRTSVGLSASCCSDEADVFMSAMVRKT